MRKGLTFSNVMSVLAVFIALGGTAVAVGVGRNTVGSTQLKNGAVRSGDIRNQQVKPIDTAPALGFDCPARTRYVGGACIELATRQATDQAAAEGRCFEASRRLPSVAELQWLRFVPGVSLHEQGEWSNDYTTFRDSNTLWGILVIPPYSYTLIAPRFSTSNPFRCVSLPQP